MNNDNSDLRKSAVKRVTEMSNNNQNRAFQQYQNFEEKVNATVTLEDVSNMNKLASGAAKLSRAVNSSLKDVQESSKEYQKVADLYRVIATKAKDLTDENNDAAKNAKIINDLYKELNKNQDKLGKGVASAIKNFLDANKETIDTAKEYENIMKKSSQTFKENLKSNLKDVKNELINLSNAFNLQKLVTGGTSIKDLSTMQGNMKISMNLDTSGFMGVQKELIEQNKEMVRQTGEAYLTFSETVSYMSNISEYSLKNYNQSIALYKQVSMGTKYLNLSNQSMSQMVKATNQLADDSYMNKQMALLAALGTDSTLAEDMNSLSGFISSNLADLNARYNNGEDVIKQSAALYTANEAYLGNNASLVNDLMSEIMHTNNFANLSQSTQNLLSMAGMSGTIHQQMASGNLDMNQIMYGVMNGLSEFTNKAGGIDSMELYGYGNWVTVIDSFERNQSSYYDSVTKQLDTMNSVDLSSAESMEDVIALLGEQNENKTIFEKFQDRIFTTLGIQDQNWTELLGVVQLLQTALTTFTAVTSIFQSIQLMGIKTLVAKIAMGQTISNLTSGKGGIFKSLGSWLSSSSMGASLGGNALGGAGALSNGAAAGLGALGIGAGLAMGFSHASQMSKGEGLDSGDIRGFFLGTGSEGKSTGENALSVVGNTAKYAAIGAGIGTIIPGIGTAIGAGVGALAGLVTGLIGTQLEDNTKAVEENTAVYGDSTDSVATKSYINKLFSDNSKGSGPDISYGVGAGGTSNNGGYPWSVTSPFGPRTLSNGDSSYHNGMDFGVRTGTPIGVPFSGTVTSVSRDNRNTYPAGPKSAGSGVYIKGTNGVTYQFWHLSSVGVNKGDKVTVGQTLGLSGNTGYSTGPHLHFGTKVGGNWVNPSSYVTAGLFSADGKFYSTPTDVSPTNTITSEKQILSKDELFQVPYSAGTGAGPSETPTPNYATSADIDRLIVAISTLNQKQNEQQEFLRALSGKNTFVYGRE